MREVYINTCHYIGFIFRHKFLIVNILIHYLRLRLCLYLPTVFLRRETVSPRKTFNNTGCRSLQKRLLICLRKHFSYISRKIKLPSGLTQFYFLKKKKGFSPKGRQFDRKTPGTSITHITSKIRFRGDPVLAR